MVPGRLRRLVGDHLDNGPTSFFLVHAVLVTVSIVAGVSIGVIGWRSVRGLRKMNP